MGFACLYDLLYRVEILRSALMPEEGSGLRIFSFSIKSFFSSAIMAIPSFLCYDRGLSCKAIDRLDVSHTRLMHYPHPVLLCVFMREVEFLDRVWLWLCASE